MAEPHHLDYLDALRGYAIFGVVAMHVSLSFPGLPEWLAAEANAGQAGVQLFFVVSAFTLMQSARSRGDGAGAFYLRRVFRLAPMWLLAVLGWTLLRGTSPTPWAPYGLSGWDIAAAALFLHGLVPWAMNGVVPGGWSIAAEAGFYALFPLLGMLLRTPLRAVAFVILAALGAAMLEAAVRPALDAVLPAGFADRYLVFWFPRQLPAFGLGILAFTTVAALRTAPRWLADLLILAGVGLVLVLPLVMTPPGPLGYGAVFGLVLVGLGWGGGRWLVNRLAIWCGQRSYSAYFWHLALLREGYLPPEPGGAPDYLFRLVLVLAATFALSHLTYLWIERPAIGLGRRLLSHIGPRLAIA